MPILISGALAYDHIMDFPGRFKDHIMPENIHILNVSFGVEKLQRSWGGTAGNIAYTMKLIGGDPIIVSAIGRDGDEYLNRLRKLEIKTDYIQRDKKLMTASCYITTDIDDNQITAFYNGPTILAGNIEIKDIKEKLILAIISPIKKEVMLKQLEECKVLGIESVFDPGQQITSFNKEELRKAIDKSSFVFGNDYEIKLMEKCSGWSKKEILSKVKVLVTTFGKRGSAIETKKNGRIDVGSCIVSEVKDPTGAGDAYRAGFFVGYEKEYDLKTCGQMGSVAASYAIEAIGTQEHYFTPDNFIKRYKKAYNEDFKLNLQGYKSSY